MFRVEPQYINGKSARRGATGRRNARYIFFLTQSARLLLITCLAKNEKRQRTRVQYIQTLSVRRINQIPETRTRQIYH